ncbi:MAG: hypothetical protein JSU00_23125 [Acidobacteria bacterium]|nr:hypothetical protein [Acidobacteriota bacterium]
MTPFSLNVTAAPQGSLPWLTAWPADLPYPYVSTLNATDGNMTANAAIVQAKSSGNLALAAGSATDVFVDINGYFAPPATGGLYFYPIPPCRVVAAKNVQSQQNYAVLNGQCPIPATAQAYSFNATAAPKNDALWQLSIWPALRRHRPMPGQWTTCALRARAATEPKRPKPTSPSAATEWWPGTRR